MGALGAKLRTLQGGRVAFWCPGCDGMHQVGVGDGPGPRWSFNGDGDRPTFTPSIRVRSVQRLTDDEHARIMAAPDHDRHVGSKTRLRQDEPKPLVCHSFVTNGRIRFLNDCTHALAGQTVDLPDFDTA